MLRHMRTSVDMPDDILEEARAIAGSQKTTLRSLMEEGLRWVIQQRKKPRRFRLRDAAVGGKGLQPGIREGSWQELREMIYRGRGT